jgi:HEAT repeat protein
MLEALLGDASVVVRVRAALALGRSGIGSRPRCSRRPCRPRRGSTGSGAGAGSASPRRTAIKFWSKPLKTKEPQQKQAALYLCELGDEASRPVLAELHNQNGLRDDEDFSALAVLGATRGRAGAGRAEGEDGRGSSRKQKLEAMFRLSELGDESARKELRILAEKRSQEQLLAANRLSSPEEPQLLTVFRPILKNEFGVPAGRQLAAEGVGKSGDLPQVKELGPLLDGKVVADGASDRSGGDLAAGER